MKNYTASGANRFTLRYGIKNHSIKIKNWHFKKYILKNAVSGKVSVKKVDVNSKATLNILREVYNEIIFVEIVFLWSHRRN